MTNFLNLPSWEVTSVKQSAHDYRVEATYSPLPERCPHCSKGKLFGGVLYRHGTYTQEVMDLPSHGKRVGITLTRVRLRCQDCGKTLLQPVPDLDARGTMTARLVRWIEAQSLKRTFVSVADDVGVTEGTVRNLFKAHVGFLDKHVVFKCPTHLGIDEVHLLKKGRAVFTNLKERTIIGVLPDRLKRSVVKYLKLLCDCCEVVTIDMCKAYKDAVRECLPKAVVVVDKFHVVRMANQCLEGVRKSLREGLEPKFRRKLMHDRFVLLRRNADLTPEQRQTLEGWSVAHPKLATAYRLKESFFDLWGSATRSEAAERFRAWEYGITDHEMIAAYRPLLTAWRNWEQEILAYFEHRETNAVTEALNGITKRIAADGRGYSFEVMRAKMLYGTRTQKRPAFGSEAVSGPAPEGGGADASPDAVYAELIEDDLLGTDVDLLLREFEAEGGDSTADHDPSEGLD